MFFDKLIFEMLFLDVLNFVNGPIFFLRKEIVLPVSFIVHVLKILDSWLLRLQKNTDALIRQSISFLYSSQSILSVAH